MSFLKKIQAKNAAAAAEAPAEEKKVNPLLKKNPLAKKPAAETKEEPAHHKKLSFLKHVKPAEEAKEESKAEEKASTTQGDIDKVVSDIATGKKKPAPLKDQPEDESTEEEENTEDTSVVEKVEAAEKAAKEEKEEKPAKKTKRVIHRRTKKEIEAEKAAAAEETAAPADDTPAPVIVGQHGTINVLGQKMSYEDAAQLVMDQFADDGWKEFEKDVIAKMDAIKIEPDMNPGTLKYVLHDLDELNDLIALPYADTKKLLDALTDKDFGAAAAYRTAHNVGGKNEQERDRNGVLALSSAQIGGKELNFIALIAAARMRWTFVSSVYNRIRYKSQVCITMSSALKMENSMSSAS
jgi:hypothetical protein